MIKVLFLYIWSVLNLITFVWVIIAITCLHKLFIVILHDLIYSFVCLCCRCLISICVMIIVPGRFCLLLRKVWVVLWNLSDHVLKTSLLRKLNLFGFNICLLATQSHGLLFFCNGRRSLGIVVRASELFSTSKPNLVTSRFFQKFNIFFL